MEHISVHKIMFLLQMQYLFPTHGINNSLCITLRVWRIQFDAVSLLIDFVKKCAIPCDWFYILLINLWLCVVRKARVQKVWWERYTLAVLLRHLVSMPWLTWPNKNKIYRHLFRNKSPVKVAHNKPTNNKRLVYISLLFDFLIGIISLVTKRS